MDTQARGFLLVAAAVVVALASFCAGPASAQSTDPRPAEGQPRGYVVFYSDHSAFGAPPGGVHVFMVREGQREYHLGRIAWGVYRDQDRVPLSPGPAQFVLRQGIVMRQVSLEVAEDKVTPVKVTLMTTDMFDRAAVTIGAFEMDVTVEDPEELD